MLLGVMGNPIAHSRSPEIHRAFARQVDLDVDYQKILVPPNKFDLTALSFLDNGSKGFNVTLPHKGDAFLFVHKHSEEALQSKAVNTVVKLSSGKLKGYNTDGPGLLADLEKNKSWKIEGKKILVIGAGGAVRGVLPSLVNAHPESVSLYNRTHIKAEQIVQDFDFEKLSAVSAENLEDAYDIVISGSSAGLLESEISLPSKIIGPNTLCYDMIYAKNMTAFQRWCLTQKCQSADDGLGMLIEQAALAFTLWTGCEVSTEAVIADMRGLINL